MRRIHKIHLIGIGGTGMGGIAEVLVNLGYQVSGSDISNNSTVQHLRDLGVIVFNEHNPDNIQSADVVVVSSAIGDDNPEVLAAREQRIPVVPRAVMLAELMRSKQGIAVAGTHGKTTTTSLVASILAEAQVDPTFVIGGRVTSFGSSARLGTGYYFVAEADESDASFLYLNPMVCIVTNIDRDHLGTYNDDFKQLRKAFKEFIHKLPFYGLAVLCLDDPEVKKLIPRLSRPIVTYGFHKQADYQAVDFKQRGTQSLFVVKRPSAYGDLQVTLNLPGQHNVLNSLAAIAVATEEGVADDKIQAALEKFKGVGRRFQKLGTFAVPGGHYSVFDDYGHHPREVKAVLDAARLSFPEQRLVMVFQPHRYTRTKDLFEDFIAVLSEVDVLILLEVYSAGEAIIPGADGRALCGSIRARGKLEPIFVANNSDLPNVIKEVVQAGDVVFMQGAGTVSKLAHSLIEKLDKPIISEASSLN